MTRTGTWSFATTTGRVEVAPGELRVRNRLRTVGVRVGRALANGRTGPVGDAVGWSGVGAALTVLGALPRLLTADGGSETLWAIGLAALTVGVTLAAAVVGDRGTAIPLEAIEHAEFDDGEVVVVHEEVDDGGLGGRLGDRWRWGWGDETGGDRTETRIRPLDDAARGDAALALRLRGVDVRGIEDDDAVSRTVVDAPKTELVE